MHLVHKKLYFVYISVIFRSMESKTFNTKKAKALMDEKGLRTSHVARTAGIAPPSLRLILNGKRNPSLSVIKLIARALGVDEDKLLT